MKFNLPSNYQNDEILEEYNITNYINKFCFQTNYIHEIDLVQLEKSEYVQYLEEIKKISYIPTESFLYDLQNLSNMSSTISAIKAKSLSLDDFLLLLQFLNFTTKYEKSLTLKENLKELKEILNSKLESKSGSYILTSDEESIQKEITKQQFKEQQQIAKTESLIKEITNYDFVYPLSAIIELSNEQTKKLEQNEWIAFSKQGSEYKIEIKPKSDELLAELMNKYKASISKKEQKLASIIESVLDKIIKLDNELRDKIKLLAKIRTQNNVSFVKLSNKFDIKELDFKNFNFEGYKKMSLSFNLPNSIVWGSNGNGKTTVLKTIYTAQVLMCLGFPIPCIESSLPYSRDPSIFIKTFKNSIESAFLQEMNFVAKALKDKNNSYFIDELFSSTGLENAKVLYEFFLPKLSKSRLVFSTHLIESFNQSNKNQYLVKNDHSIIDLKGNLDLLKKELIIPKELIERTKLQKEDKNSLLKLIKEKFNA